MHDAIVVGGGPAGLAAATWLARYRRRVLVIDAGEQRNRWVETSHGYLTRDAEQPAEMLRLAREQLAAYPYAERLDGRVSEARRTPDGFAVTVDGLAYEALRLVLATGVEDAFPDVDGFLDHYGTSVFHCPTCDGYEARDRHVVVLGWSEHVAGFALTLLDWAASITVVTDGRSFAGDREAVESYGIRVVEDVAERFVGSRGSLRGIVMRGGGELRCDLAFFSVAHRPRTGLGADLDVAMTDDGCVAVGDRADTSVPGVYAAGDVTPGMQLVQVAAAKGAVAGVSAAQSLRGSTGAPASPPPGPDPEAALHV